MKRTLLLALLVNGMLLPTEAVRASDSSNDKSISFVRVDEEVFEILKRTSPEGPEYKGVPNFALKTRDNSFVFSINGNVNTIFGYDFGNNLYKAEGGGVDFVPSAIPVPAVAGQKADYFINPFNGALIMQFVGFAGTDNEISAYFKLESHGNSPEVKFSKAFMSWRGLSLGLKSTLINDGSALQPPTIDPQGPAGGLNTNAYEISYTSKSYNGFRFAAGLDMPTFYSSSGVYRGKDYEDFTGKPVVQIGHSEQLIPDIPMWVEYSWSDWNRIRLSGLFRDFTYRDILKNKTRHSLGYGVMLSGNLQPVEPLILYFEGIYGRGIGAYIQDMAGLPLSYVPTSDRPGHMDASPMMGLNLGATINVSKKVQFNVIGSESRIWKVGEYCLAPDSGTDYKYGLYIAANMFYSIKPYLSWGVEYLYGKHGTWSGTSGHDNRIQTQLKFSF